MIPGTSSKQDEGDARERQRHEFAEQVDLIRAGKHLGWIEHLAKIYFGLYGDSDRTVTRTKGSQPGWARQTWSQLSKGFAPR